MQNSSLDNIFVYICCKNVQEARKIAGHCVSERLAASGNILPNMESVYWWDGDINSANEAVLILKTTKDRYEEIEKAVNLLHSYECPCIVTLPVTGGYKPFLEWMRMAGLDSPL